MKIELLDCGGHIPTKAKIGDACFDCYIDYNIKISPLETTMIPLGFGLNLPYGFMATLKGRSSLSSKGILTHIGTIDSGYRGEIKACITNLTKEPIFFSKGDRICQLLIERIEDVELFFNERGKGGFGSSGR